MIQGKPDAAAVNAYRALEQLIVTLELEPGSTTSEKELIDRVGLGRTPVREAIQRLAWEGFIEIRPRAGLAIAPLRPADWLSVLEARSPLEVILARDAAGSSRAGKSEELNAVAEAMLAAKEQDSATDLLKADKVMDETIAGLAANPFAARPIGPLQTHSRRFWFSQRAKGEIALSAQAHVAVLDALREGHPQNAVRATEALMKRLKRFAIKS